MRHCKHAGQLCMCAGALAIRRVCGLYNVVTDEAIDSVKQAKTAWYVSWLCMVCILLLHSCGMTSRTWTSFNALDCSSYTQKSIHIIFTIILADRPQRLHVNHETVDVSAKADSRVKRHQVLLGPWQVGSVHAVCLERLHMSITCTHTLQYNFRGLYSLMKS